MHYADGGQHGRVRVLDGLRVAAVRSETYADRDDRGDGVDERAEAVVRAFFASWTEMDLEVHAGFFHEDGVYVDGTLRFLEGVDAIKEAVATYPKHHVDIKKMVSGDGVVMVERVDNFHLDGKPFSLDVVGVFEIDRDGLITRWRDCYDLKSITDQVEAAGVRTAPG